MEALIAQAMKDSAALRKTSVPWTDDEPYPQPYYAFDPATASWVAQTPLARDDSGPGDPDAAPPEDHGAIDTIALHSWNIDFMLPFGDARMRSALAHLDGVLRAHPSPRTAAAVVFLQECTPADLATIAATPWVRARFHLTDRPDARHWATTHYGTVTLVDARLPITAAFRVHYAQTRMDRDALFVDVSVPTKQTVRLCNTHLESLAMDPPLRPHQMQLVARYLRADHVHAGLVAGDFNAIQPADRTLHTANGLQDAFLALGGTEDTAAGYTWGQQAATQLREQFGCSRMDKVYFCGGGLDVVRFDRFGADVLVEGEAEREQIMAIGFEKAWVTDHLGIRAEVKLVPGASESRL